MVCHYIGYKIDIFDVDERCDVADMGTTSEDSNADLWEILIHAFIKGLEETVRDPY